jgi:gamma-glutamylcyclotransferase
MSDSATFLYFAYGSNMLTRRLRERAPSARTVASASLPGHELRWHKVSRDGSAKCDAVPVPSPASVVYGVVFEIDNADKRALDLAEGIGMGYKPMVVDVRTGSGSLCAWTYQATNTDHMALPYAWYKALVVAGAREHGLPSAYVAALEAAAVKADHDTQRSAQNMQLLHVD